MEGWFSKPRANKRGRWLAAGLLGVGLTAAICSAEPASGSAKVTAVRFWSLGDVTRVAVEVSSEFRFKYDRLSNPERLFFDIHGARPQMVQKGVHTIAVGDGLLTQIRVAETQPEVTRVVLDLVQPAAVTTSQLSNPDRLIIELRSKDKPAPPASPSITGGKQLTEPPADLATVTAAVSKESAVAAPATKDVAFKEAADLASAPSAPAKKSTPRAFEAPAHTAKPAPQLEAVAAPSIRVASKLRVPATPLTLRRDLPPPADPAPLPAPAADSAASSRTAPRDDAPVAKPSAAAELGKEPLPAKRGSVSADRSMTRALGLKLGRVVLDPGHGGHDVGTHGPSGYYEKDLALDVAQRLGMLIEQDLGSEVIFTRSDDTFIPLEERTRIANDHKADLFLSIHANSSPYRAAAGVETYILNFTTSKTALDLAARENASSERSIYDLQDLLQKIALRDKVDESREFASRLQTSLSVLSKSSNEGAKNRGVKKAPFVVLIGASMPSVLAEIGFLSNASDEALLRRPEHRQKIAEALYKGIAAYANTLSHFQVAKSE